MNAVIPFKLKSNLFRWGPIPGKYFLNADGFEATLKLVREELRISWPDTLFLFWRGRMVWVNDAEALVKKGAEVFHTYMLPAQARNGLKEEWDNRLAVLLERRQGIESTDLKALSDEEFIARFQDFHTAVVRLWVPTIPWELGNYGAEVLLEHELRSAVPPEDMPTVLEVLTAPEALSFYQREEIALAETDDMEGHAEKYFWIGNSYGGTRILPPSYFSKRRENLDSSISHTSRQAQDEVRNRKEKVVAKYSLRPDVVAVADAMCRGVEWQDLRKEQVFRYLYTKQLLGEEVARRLGVALSDLLNFSPNEILALWKGEEVVPSGEDRSKSFGYFVTEEGITTLDCHEAERLWAEYAEEAPDEGADVAEVKGMVASAGGGVPVRGPVRIVLDPHVVDSFQEGEVLVAPMTSPDYVFAMKKSVAIVTDAGGLTAHAAIVSRELKKPCIVGTKTATKVFKDGEVVEVDPVRGTVRKVHGSLQ